MKWLFTLLLTGQALGTTLTNYHSSPDASSEQTFVLEDSKAVYQKSSNFFDRTKDLSLGKFELPDSKSVQGELARLSKLLTKIQDVDKFLKGKDSSFNDFSEKSHHRSFILLDQYRVTQGSTLYPELKEIFEKLQGKSWKQVSGMRLSDDYKTLIKVDGGRDVGKEEFSFLRHCKGPRAPTICSFKDLGTLHLR